MRTIALKPSSSFWIGVLCSFPALFFISILKYGLGLHFFYNVSEPVLTSLGLEESIGSNINVVILFGPLVSFLINLRAIVALDVSDMERRWLIEITVRKRRKNIVLIAISSLLLLTLFFYLIGENL